MSAERQGAEPARWVRVDGKRAGTFMAMRVDVGRIDTVEPAPVCLVIADLESADAVVAFEAALDLAHGVLPEGCVAFVTALAATAPGEAGSDARGLADRAACARLDDLVDHLAEDPLLDGERAAIVGLGRGGTLAYLFACHSSRVTGAASLGGPLTYPELGPARPVQPLELALNLGCPLLWVCAQDDPATPAAAREGARALLSQFARTFDIVTLPGPVPPSGSRGEARAALVRFLGEVLEIA